MDLLELTLPSPAENLALDEALLEAAETGEGGDVLRLWESDTTFVVVGRSSRLTEEVNLEACRTAGVSVLRRISGGAAVVAGRGCLMYSVVQSYAGREQLRMLDELHRHVLGTVRRAASTVAPGIAHMGTCDLVIEGRKFSGNAVRCKRDHFLYHGTLLYAFDLRQIELLLKMPLRQPDYRQGRLHGEFVTNVPVSSGALRRALVAAFGAARTMSSWPEALTNELAVKRYTCESWTFSR